MSVQKPKKINISFFFFKILSSPIFTFKFIIIAFSPKKQIAKKQLFFLYYFFHLTIFFPTIFVHLSLSIFFSSSIFVQLSLPNYLCPTQLSLPNPTIFAQLSLLTIFDNYFCLIFQNKYIFKFHQILLGFFIWNDLFFLFLQFFNNYFECFSKIQ